MLSHYSSTKLGEGRGSAYSRGGAYFKFWPIGGALIRGGGTLIRRFTVLIIYHLIASRNQFDDEDRSSRSPENAARELGFSEEAELRGIKYENQTLETDQFLRQECGYAMLTPRTMMVNSIKVWTNYRLLQKHRILDLIKNKLVVHLITLCVFALVLSFIFPVTKQMTTTWFSSSYFSFSSSPSSSFHSLPFHSPRPLHLYRHSSLLPDPPLPLSLYSSQSSSSPSPFWCYARLHCSLQYIVCFTTTCL